MPEFNPGGGLELLAPPRNPARLPPGIEGGLIEMLLGPVQQVLPALRGQMTDAEAQDFAMTAAMGAIGPRVGRAAKLFSPRVLETTSGGSVTEYKDAFRLAKELAEQAGFELRSASSQSPSLYFAKPGRDEVLRISDHPNYHPGKNAATVEARLRPGREEVVHRFSDPDMGEIVDQEYMNIIRDSPDDIRRAMAAAILEYGQLFKKR